VENTLAYYNAGLVTRVKKLAPGVNVVKLFFSSLTLEPNKLKRLSLTGILG
jgi:hypothetical protein